MPDFVLAHSRTVSFFPSRSCRMVLREGAKNVYQAFIIHRLFGKNAALTRSTHDIFSLLRFHGHHVDLAGR